MLRTVLLFAILSTVACQTKSNDVPIKKTEPAKTVAGNTKVVGPISPVKAETPDPFAGYIGDERQALIGAIYEHLLRCGISPDVNEGSALVGNVTREMIKTQRDKLDGVEKWAQSLQPGTVQDQYLAWIRYLREDADKAEQFLDNPHRDDSYAEKARKRQKREGELMPLIPSPCHTAARLKPTAKC